MNEQNKKPTLKERFRYWFDNQMANGSLGLIKLLLIATVLVIVLVTALIMLLGADDEVGTIGILWDTMTTTINAWMPYSGDGSIAYLILMAIAAIAGVLVTSVLIGIFSSAIEEKITDLKNGNSEVLEQDHIVVLGYVSGEYVLLQQLVKMCEDNSRCVVVAGDMTRADMEAEIYDNVEIPKNVRVVCRNIDIHDPMALKKCCIESAQAVIVQPADDIGTVKALLAATTAFGAENDHTAIYSVVSDSKYLLSDSYSRQYKIAQLQTNRVLAKLIAHSCTQAGLSRTFVEFLDYRGCNFCEIDLAKATNSIYQGLSFREIVSRMTGGVPIGVLDHENCILNPSGERILSEEDKLLVFTEYPDKLGLRSSEAGESAGVGFMESASDKAAAEKPIKVLFFGVNEEMETILEELPEQEIEIRIAGADTERQEEILECVSELNAAEGAKKLQVEFVRETVPSHKESLEQFISDAEHVVVLADHELEEDEADVPNILRILSLREIRKNRKLKFNITAELSRERNQILADDGDGTDFVVAINMISLFLSQLADRPHLEMAFRELLSNEGNELYLKDAGEIGCAGAMTVAQARERAYKRGYILLGYVEDQDGIPVSTFNPDMDQTVEFSAEDRLIVVGEM